MAGGALVVPYVMVLLKAPDILSDITRFVDQKGSSSAFDVTVFGAALTVGVAFITQMGEQADVLRFMPAKTPQNCWRWWVSMLVGCWLAGLCGPGWVVLGVAMMPGMDGFEMARRLKALPATAYIPIIFMTGLCETEHLAAPQAPGVLLGWLIDAARQLHSGQRTAAAWDWLTVRTC